MWKIVGNKFINKKFETMNLIVKFFCFLLVLGIAGLFFIKKPDGTPWLSLDDFIPDARSIKNTLDDAMPEQIIGGGESESVAVYKWRDSNGTWQYSDRPPKGLEAEQIFVSSNANRDLSPAPLPTIDPEPAENKNGRAVFIKDSSLSPTTIAPDKIATLIEDAKNIQNLVDERQKILDASLNRDGQ